MSDTQHQEIAALRAEVARLAALQGANASPRQRPPYGLYAVIGAIGAVIFLAGYFGSPLLALHDLRQAARTGDRDKLEQLVDFPQVRANLKSKIDAYVVTSIRNDPNMANNPFAGLGALIVPAIADRAIDTYVTPDGIAAAVNSGAPPKLNATDAASQAQTGPATKLSFAPRFTDLDHVTVDMTRLDAPGATLTLVLERHGLFAWKLTRIDFVIPQTPAPADQATPQQPAPVQEAAQEAAPAAAPAATDADSASPAAHDTLASLSAQDAQIFGRYAAPLYSGPTALPDFAGRDRADREYRTMIMEGVRSGQAFAGRLAIAQFGCGTDCSTGYVIDLGTGQVFDLPVGGDDEPDVNLQYVKDSRLMRANWNGPTESGGGCVYEDFVWTGRAFASLGRHADPRPCPSN